MTWPKIILMYVVFPALTEELVDRGLLQRYVLSKWPLVGVVVSALAFASIHFTTNWFHFAMFALSGLNFAYIYHRTGRLEVSITVHAIGNLLILVWIMATL